jgi:small subunit ribosomal protein S16
MALKIRLRQQGKKNRQTYRVVLMDARNKRDGKYLENLGWYDPFAAEKTVSVDPERIAYWLEKGAEISDHAKDLVAKSAPEVIQSYMAKKIAKRTKLVARRRAAKKA